jgi:hypothetical protein
MLPYDSSFQELGSVTKRGKKKKRTSYKQKSHCGKEQGGAVLPEIEIEEYNEIFHGSTLYTG